MQASYRLKLEELTESFISQLKTMFSDEDINVEITVEKAEDETERLLRSQTNREHLLNAIEEVRQGQHGHTMTMEELERFEI